MNKITISLNICIIEIAKSEKWQSHKQKLIFFGKTIIDITYSKLDMLSSLKKLYLLINMVKWW